jgi:hypothetical protein
MKIKLGGLAAIVGSAVLCLTLPAFGQVTITFNGDGAGDGSATLNGTTVDTGVYSATISGLPGASSGVVCDDFNHSLTTGETWNATALQASSLNASNIGNTEFGATIGLGGYAEVATLVAALFNGTTTLGGITGLTVTDLSEAIWAITTPTPGITSGLSNNAKALVSWLTSNVGGLTGSALASYLAQFSNLWILTPDPKTGGQQELWTSVPEGGAALLYLLLAGLACFGAMKFGSRSQLEAA